MINKVVLQGRIVKDMEVKSFADKQYTQGTIAISRNFKNKNGNYDADFISFTIWGTRADAFVKHTKKGDMVILEGRLVVDSYTNAETNATVHKHYINVNDFSFCSTATRKVTAKADDTIDIPDLNV